MFATISRQLAAILCTVVMSAACIVGAVGPAQADAPRAAITQTVA